MKNYIWFIGIVIVIIIQDQITIWDNQLNLTCALVFVYAIKHISKTPHIKGYWSGRGEINSAIFGAIVGGIEDILSDMILGPSMLGKSIIAWATAFVFSDIIYKWTPFMLAVVLFVFTISDSLIMITSRLIITDIEMNYLKIMEIIIIQGFVNLPIVLFIKSPREI